MGLQLSYSAATKYTLSPMAYFLHYLMRLRPEMTGSALVFGSAVDMGLNSILTDMRDGREPSIEIAKARFDDEFGATDPHTIKYSRADKDLDVLTAEDELDFGESYTVPVEYLCLKRKGHMMLEAYAEQILPKLEKVLLVQHEISLDNELGDKLIGVVDLVAQIGGKTYILDNKTSGVKYSEDSASVSQQLGTYYEALKDEYKLDGVGFIVIPKNVRKKKEPLIPIDIKLGSVSEKILGETFAMYDKALDGIKNARFECTRETRDGCCSAPWGCSYKLYCESNGQDTMGLQIVEKK